MRNSINFVNTWILKGFELRSFDNSGNGHARAAQLIWEFQAIGNQFIRNYRSWAAKKVPQ